MVFKGRFTRYWPIIVILPALLLYLLFVLLPALGNVMFSFTDFNGNIHSKMQWVGLQNYIKAFTSDMDNLGKAIKVTIIFSLAVTLIQNIIAVFMAVLVNMKLKLRSFYRAVIFLPSVLGVVVIGLIWNLIFDPYSGPVNLFLQQFGADSALFGDPDIAIYLVIFVVIWANFGYAMIIYLAGLQGIPNELYEAGKIDGTSNWSSFRHITLPLLQPSITINVLISIIGALGTYDIIMVLTNGGPGIATRTIGLYVFKSIFAGGSQGYVSALSMIHFSIVFVVVLITQFYLRRREAEL